MSANNIELQILGQVLRLQCPPEHQENLLASARRLEERIAKLKEQSGIVQIEKVLMIVALNLNYELEQAQRQNEESQNMIIACIEQLNNSLAKIQSNSQN